MSYADSTINIVCEKEGIMQYLYKSFAELILSTLAEYRVYFWNWQTHNDGLLVNYHVKDHTEVELYVPAEGYIDIYICSADDKRNIICPDIESALVMMRKVLTIASKH